MKIRIQVKPGRQEESFRFVNGIWLLKINAPAREGLANERVIAFLSELFRISPSEVSITKGHTAPFKTIEINISEEQLQSLQ